MEGSSTLFKYLPPVSTRNYTFSAISSSAQKRSLSSLFCHRSTNLECLLSSESWVRLSEQERRRKGREHERRTRGPLWTKDICTGTMHALPPTKVRYLQKQYVWRYRIAGRRNTRNNEDPRPPISHPESSIRDLREKQAYIRT